MSMRHQGKEIHVKALASTNATTPQKESDGSPAAPFATIQEAANIAKPGDTVIVHDGTYREEVDPKRGGFHEYARITYTAADGEHPVIKGSEVISNWENTEGTVWHTSVPNTLFGDYNPYTIPLVGDWLEQPHSWDLSLGDVYLNGKSMYEAETVADVKEAKERTSAPGPQWIDPVENLLHPEDSVYQWHADVTKDTTEIWANFQGKDPNHEVVEINVRRSCFFPSHTGRDYITVRGFEMAQAACGWAPPTAAQFGLLGANWSKGWIIENNDIHDAKCSGVSLGKDYSTGDQEAYYTQRKPGYQFQLESVFLARHRGWDVETIGSHIVRNNTIHDCGQNGIVGHLGCIGSVIENNDIYAIGTKHEFFGHEIGGIKLHAPIDVVIRKNTIHQCALGTWLDWQAQGTRVSSNAYFDNDRDFMIEVTHGPCLVDNNVFASPQNVDNHAQGTAFVHNLFLGGWTRKPIVNRFTPYHFPHSTEILGTACVYSGDDRIYQNIFVGGTGPLMLNAFRGTSDYDGLLTSEEDFVETVHGGSADPLIGDISLFEKVKQPVFIDGNVYLKDSPSFDKETSKVTSSEDPEIRVYKDDDGKIWLEGNFGKDVFDVATSLLDTESLDRPRIVGELYENPDGTPLVVDHDLTGAQRGDAPVPGPLEALRPGKNKIQLF
ncbi:MAG: right-handed parallel beta-helix repeat-containing protein [Bifidobacteriaceae bacterium]|jgi:hypothetical protein|nr:right-handed parallel beta-helix repeat-containing protein [Bifidobacteriaceae bacterium]